MKNSLFIFFLLATLTLILLVATTEYLYSKKHKLVQSISSMVGEHLVDLRTNKDVGGPMSQNSLTLAMNQVIDPDDDEKAKSAIETMLGVVVEAKRKSFHLPMVHKDVLTLVAKWSEKTDSHSSKLAAKLLTHVYDRNLQHMDQLISQSYVNISETDPILATKQMRSLSHYVDGANVAGISLDPKIILLSPNDKIVNKWLLSEDVKVKNAAQFLLQNIEESRTL